jgi:uncharacterized protein
MPDPSARFSNQEIAPAELPDFQRVDLHPVAPAYVAYAVIAQVLFWMILVLIAVALRVVPFSPFSPAWWTVGLICLAATWFGIMAWLDARRRGWALREHDLIYRQGIVWRRTVIVPFARIQHVETSSGPLERAFGLMRVKCFTAGGAMSDLSVVGLDSDSARKVRQHLLEQIRDAGDTEPDTGEVGDVDDA